MHNCPKCHRTIPDARFCPYCAAEQLPAQNQPMQQNYPQYQNRQTPQNQMQYHNPNPNNYQQQPYQRANPMQHNNFFGQQPQQQKQWQQSQPQVQQKKNAVIVDEKDFVIYDVPPKDSSLSDRHAAVMTPPKEYADIPPAENRIDRAPEAQPEEIHYGYGMAMDEDPDKTRIFIRPPKKKTTDITEPDSYRRPEKDFRSIQKEQKKAAPKLHICGSQPAVVISKELSDILRPPKPSLDLNTQAAVSIPAELLRVLNSADENHGVFTDPHNNSASPLPLILITQPAVAVSEMLT